MEGDTCSTIAEDSTIADDSTVADDQAVSNGPAPRHFISVSLSSSSQRSVSPMDLPTTSRLYDDALAASKFADQRLETRTRNDYTGSLRRFAEFCKKHGYPNPLRQRFVELPSVVAAYVNVLAKTNTSQWPAEKLRAALAWHYTRPEMLTGGHPHDRWVVETTPDGRAVARGNPARSAAITQILAGLSKAKKRERTPKRASPMSLAMLSRLFAFLESDATINGTMRAWFPAVCALCFYGMCRINEVLLMRKGDIQLGLHRKSRKDGSAISFGCFTIRDRKTDHDPLASRTYSLHYLPKEEKAAEALSYVSRWFDYAQESLHHKWRDDDYAFPGITKIPRASRKRRRAANSAVSDTCSFGNVSVKWGSPMADSNFTQVLNIVAEASGISKNLLGDEIWFTSHCFRRGGAQYRFMFAPEQRRWSLKLVKWWAGWSQSEKAETVVRYLLDDVMDREENQLGDSLAPDAVTTTTTVLESVLDMEYDCALPESTADNTAIDTTTSVINDIKEAVLEGLKDMIKDIGCSQAPLQEIVRAELADMPAAEANVATVAEPIVESTAAPTELVVERSSEATSNLMSELPDAKSWRDYVTQYWTPNPACHQYRAGVNMLPEEKKIHRSRLSRMKIIAEFVRDNFGGDLDRFEKKFGPRVPGDMTVNKLLTAIRQQKRRPAAVLI